MILSGTIPEVTSATGFPAARMLAVKRTLLLFVAVLSTMLTCSAQEPNAEKPQVKVNVLNVCTPSKEEQQEISAALARIPKHPSFSSDFEVDRGRSVLDPNANPLAGTAMAAQSDNAAVQQTSSQPASAQFVRIRHEFSNGAAFSNVQYSFSRDAEQMIETIVFRLREPKDVMEISVESRASSVTTPPTMLTSGTPAGRIKLERFGKSSVVLARCSGGNGSQPIDQSAYEPLFSSASSILSEYRRLLDTKRLVPEELARMHSTPATHKNSSSGAHHQ